MRIRYLGRAAATLLLAFAAGVSAVVGSVALQVELAAPAGAVAPPAGAVAPGSCGSVLLAGSAWLGGGGVNVMSNDGDEGKGKDCSSASSYVNGVYAGEEWQCVEMVNRLYLSKGWISSHWAGDAGDPFYDNAPGNLTKQPNGSVSYLGPGDVVVINVFYNGASLGGHVLVVNDSSNVTSGTVDLVSQNSGDPSKAEPQVSGIISGGSVSVGGGGGGWTYSTVGVVHAPTAAPPSAPGAPSATAFTHGSGQASVSWSAPADNGAPIDNYQVEEDNDQQTWTTSGTSLTVGGLTDGDSYQFEVQAHNSAGWGGWSGWSNWVIPYGPPGAPSTVTATAGDGSATVSWQWGANNNDNGSTITGYTATASLPGDQSCSTTGALSCTVRGLTNGTSYTFTVQAANAAGAGQPSSPSNVVIPRGPPYPPSKVSAAARPASAVVSWLAPTSNGGSPITGYTATAVDLKGSTGRQCSTTGALSCTVRGLTNGTSYTFTVKSRNAYGASAPSLKSNAVIPATDPGQPLKVSAVAGNRSATVAWRAPVNNGGAPVTAYTATASPGGKGCSTTGALSCTVASLTLGSRYSFTVVATNWVGSGASSAKSNAVLIGTPSAPTGVSVYDQNKSLVISWSPAAGNGYPVDDYTATVSPGRHSCSTPAFSCQITGLSNGVTYTVTVVAKNAEGTSPASLPKLGRPVGPPSSPLGVSAVSANASAIVTWSAPAYAGSGVTSYTVTSSPGAKTCTWSSGPLTCTVRGLTNGRSYTFAVVALDEQGDSPASANSAPVHVGLPWSPTSVFATPGNASAIVSWRAPATGGGAVASYLVTSTPGAKTCSTTGALSCTVRGLTNGTSYTFTVKSRNAYGASAPSRKSNAVVPEKVPGAPYGVKATAGVGMATVTWSAPASVGSGVTSYTVTSSPGAKTCTWSSGPLTCTVKGLANGTTYTFTVKASDRSGVGAASVPSNSITTPNVPDAPQDVTASASGQSVEVSWSAPDSYNGSAITGYTATAAPGGATCSTSTTSCTVRGLTNGTSYTFTVTATNAVGTGPPSAPSAAVLIESTPDAPVGASGGGFNYVLTAGGDGYTTGTLNWSPPDSDNGSAITGYVITGLPGCGSASGTSCSTSSLVPDTSYTACVYAVNSVGESSGNSCTTFETPDGYEIAGIYGVPVFPAANDGNPGGPLYDLSANSSVTVVCRVSGQSLGGDPWWYELTNGDYGPADDFWNTPIESNFHNGIYVDYGIPVC